MTRYGFSQAIGGLFVADYAALRALLPKGLVPLEAQPGFGVCAITAFDFVESEVGAYGELVVSVLVTPWAPEGDPLPDAAYFPFFLGTTTESSRQHATDKWQLPSFERCVDVHFESDAEGVRVRAEDAGVPILSLSVGHASSERSSKIYQCFSRASSDVQRVSIEITGPLDEHEEELGLLFLGDHPLSEQIAAMVQDEVPFREHSMRAGEQRFGNLQPHGWHT